MPKKAARGKKLWRKTIDTQEVRLLHWNTGL